jgi:uncharacterized protein (TIGR01777 family)
MKILVSGASGLIGSHLVRELEANQHQVSRLVRRPTKSPSEIPWDPSSVPQQVSGFGGVPDEPDFGSLGWDAVIHLAGETIMGRWTSAKKARILESRETGTHNLSEALASAAARPQCLLVASAVGYYGPHGDEILTETSPPGDDFLAHVGREWEAAAEPARRAGIRVVNLRTGMVLTPHGGALKRMLTPFRLGAGGRLGSGKQWVSWIALDDLLQAIRFVLQNESLSGPVNLTAPNPVTNAEFTRALGQALHRPTLFPMPGPIVRAVFGEMGEALLLSGQRVIPEKLLASGYRFLHPEIGEALQSMLR